MIFLILFSIAAAFVSFVVSWKLFTVYANKDKLPAAYSVSILVSWSISFFALILAPFDLASVGGGLDWVTGMEDMDD